MALILKTVEAFGCPGGYALLLHNEDGTRLPGQVSCVVEQGFDQAGFVTVKFLLTGDEVRLEP